MWVQTHLIARDLFAKFEQNNVMYNYVIEEHRIANNYAILVNETYKLQLGDIWGVCCNYAIYYRKGLKLTKFVIADDLDDGDLLHDIYFDEEQPLTRSQICEQIFNHLFATPDGTKDI